MSDLETLLEVAGVSVTFDGFRAINDLSFQIGPAELRAVIGPNGAGKTTMMDIITGKTRPDAGQVTYGNPARDLLKMNESAIARAGIGRKFQRPTVFENQSVFDNLLLALQNARSPLPVVFYRHGPSDTERVDALASEVGLLDEVQRLAGELSHGQKQWLEIGMLLAQDPKLLLVDEPAAGMTPQEREHTTDILKSAAETRAVIVVEHDMEFVRRLDCRVTVLHEGSVLSEGSIDHVTRDEAVIDVYLGR
ncbi:MAG: urea ABC transporter ATP-binding protein UrtD [Pseudomonadota bacterium]